MSAPQAAEYAACAKIIVANEMLRDITVADMPHLKHEHRKVNARKLERAAKTPGEEMSFKEFAKRVGLTDGRKDSNSN